MKKQIIEALNNKFQGLRAEVAERLATRLATKITSEAEIAALVEGLGVQDIMDSYADSRTSEAVRGAVSNYEKKYGIKDGKPVEPPTPAPTPTPTPEPQPNDINAQLLAAVQALTARVEGFEKGKVAETRQTAIQSIISQLPENLRKPYSRMNFDGLNDEEFTALQEEIKGEVETINRDINAKGASFGIPKGSTAPTATGEASQADIDNLASVLGIN